MIRLTLPPRPGRLTEEEQDRLARKYESTDQAVWGAPYLKEAVFAIAQGKCAYSECRLNQEGNYMEIDHFFPKSVYPQKVVEWGNLLPASKKCNLSKGDHDPAEEPIVNPLTDNPQEHFCLVEARFRGKTQKGKSTIAVLALNDTIHFVKPRFDISNKVRGILEERKDELDGGLESFQSKSSSLKKFLNKLKGLMEQASPSQEYSATVATAILQSEDYEHIEQVLRRESLWDEELEGLLGGLRARALLK